MKPVRLVRDIVRTKTAAGSKSGKGKFRIVRKLASFKIPFYIWSVVILAEAVCVLEIIPKTVLNPILSPINVAEQAALAQNIVASVSTSTAPTSTMNDVVSSAPPAIQAGLLPLVKMPPFKPTNKPTSTAALSEKVAVPAVPATITARSLLDATTLNAIERYDGPYKVTLTTAAGTYGKITWGIEATTLTVGKSVFSVSSSCNPAPNVPAIGASDRSLTFDMQTSYACTIGLTPDFGSNRIAQSKQFSFTTGTGQLVVTQPSSMDTLLHDGVDLGGFVFNNESAHAITITGLGLDISYTALNTGNPLLLKFLDPATNAQLADYHMETIAASLAAPYMHMGTGVTIPLSFTINAGTQKMLPLSIIGVQRLQIGGVDPAITITVRKVVFNQNLNRTVLNSASISWSCVVVPIGGYNPNATSGPYASGRGCSQ